VDATNLDAFSLHYSSLLTLNFLADRTNGRAIATLLRLSVVVCLSVCL